MVPGGAIDALTSFKAFTPAQLAILAHPLNHRFQGHCHHGFDVAGRLRKAGVPLRQRATAALWVYECHDRIRSAITEALGVLTAFLWSVRVPDMFPAPHLCDFGLLAVALTSSWPNDPERVAIFLESLENLGPSSASALAANID